MPVKLAKGSFGQVLLRSRNILARGQVRHHLLSDPATIEQPCLGVGESPLQISDYPIVGGLLAQVIRVLKIELSIRATWVNNERREYAELQCSYLIWEHPCHSHRWAPHSGIEAHLVSQARASDVLRFSF